MSVAAILRAGGAYVPIDPVYPLERQRMMASDAGVMWLQLAFMLATLLVFFTACAVFEIPHGALGLEMSADPHQRERLSDTVSRLFLRDGTPPRG